MGDMVNEGASLSAGIDLSQFYQVFFEEAGENLDRMEQQLLAIDIASADDEALNSIFRCAHSVKGGAATFGFSDVAELTHQMETLLDKLRRYELVPTSEMVDVLLESGDALRALLARHQGYGGEALDTRALLAGIRSLASGSQSPASRPDPAPASKAPSKPESAPAAVAVAVAVPAVSQVSVGAPSQTDNSTAATAQERVIELWVGPLERADGVQAVLDAFHEIVDLGTIEPLDDGQLYQGHRRFKVRTCSSDSDMFDMMSFHVDRQTLSTRPWTGPEEPLKSHLATEADPGYGFFENAPGAPVDALRAPGQSHGAHTADATNPATRPTPGATGANKADKQPAALESSTLRVSVDKVDQLINLVGELVITQAMLAQNSKDVDAAVHLKLAAGLADLERNTRDLQESVMSIRMIPMSVVFSRFPRMLRDLASKLGKKIELVTIGEATELDKGLVEKITDPLTHLVRNSCDHGIEFPLERLAKGKAEAGTIMLSASHQGGSVVIEVRDDGKGLSRQKLLAKAREKGMDAPDSMTDAEVWDLIFAPGFSTAEVVSEVSGRGVGMDVVKRNITSLGGRVEIDSAEGYGMSVKVRLPLTLAIMDGMSVGVGDECYILPLSSVVESFQVRPGMIRTVGGDARIVQVRDEYMPVLELEQVFNVPRFDFENVAGIMVVVEAEGARVALLVDELLGQQQVVVKNLESNYRRVSDVSGATIMGDGRVALILDVGSLVRANQRLAA
jgi:two-component system chemotaxis sensor kinase CheA